MLFFFNTYGKYFVKITKDFDSGIVWIVLLFFFFK